MRIMLRHAAHRTCNPRRPRARRSRNWTAGPSLSKKASRKTKTIFAPPPRYLLAAAGWAEAVAELIDIDEDKSARGQSLMGARQPFHGQAVFEKRRNQGDCQSTSEPTGA